MGKSGGPCGKTRWNCEILCRLLSPECCYQDGRVPPAPSRRPVGLAVALKLLHTLLKEDCLHNTFWTVRIHSYAIWLM